MNPRSKRIIGGVTLVLVLLAVFLYLEIKKAATHQVPEVTAVRKHKPTGQSEMRSTEQASPPPVENPLAETTAEAWQRAVLAITAEDIVAYLQRKRRWWSIASAQRFLERANLSQEKTKELKNAIVDKAFLDYELRVTARQMGLSTDSSGFANLRAAEEQRIKDRITSLVDERFYNSVAAQSDTNAFLIYSSETFGQAYEEGVPFSPEQRSAFEDIQKQLNRGNRRFTEYPVDSATGFTQYDDEMFRLASGLLSAEQMDVFKRMRREFNLYRDNYRQVKEHYDIFHGKSQPSGR